MNPDDPVVLSNNAVTTTNFRVERDLQEFPGGPCKGQRFVIGDLL